MSTPEAAGNRTEDMGKKVTLAENRRTEIIAALGYLFTGV